MSGFAGDVQDVEARTRPVESLRTLALRGTAWTFGGYAAAQVVRLASNLILTRLLFREAFGVMLIVNLVMQGLSMLSDLGTGPCIIQHQHGADRPFLRTAFTIQAIRGVIIWIAAMILAWPLALIYWESGLEEHTTKMEVASIIGFVGIVSLLNGLASTKLVTLNKRLVMERLTVLDLVTSLLGTSVMILVAAETRSIWSLAIGPVVTAFLRTIGSHAWLPGERDGFGWDKAAAAEIKRFGRWIFASSSVAFFAERGNALLLVYYMHDAAQRGLFNNALMLATVLDQALGKLWQAILFPTYRRLLDRGSDHMRSKLLHIRLGLIGISAPPLAFLAIFGDWVYRALYPDSFHDGGWMLRVLAAGQLLTPRTTVHPLLLATGDSYRFTILNVWTGIIQIGALFVGMASGGVAGLVVGFAAGPILTYPFQAWILRKKGMWLPWLDAAHVILAGAIVAMGYAVV